MLVQRWWMPNLEMSGSWVTAKRTQDVHGRIPPLGNVKPHNMSYFNQWQQQPWHLVCLHDDSLTSFDSLSLFAHFCVFQSAQIVIPLAIRSFIKELYSDEGNKGDGGDHSGLRSLHGTGSRPLQNGLQGLLSSGQKCFWQGAYCVGCKRM